MSLDNRIIELQNKKKQIAFLNKIQDLVTKRAGDDDILTAIAEPLNTEIGYQINHIETGERRPEVFEVFSEDEIRALRGVAKKVLSPKKNRKETVKEQPKPNMENKLSFHMANRHLVGKRVKVAGDPGIVKGLDAPDAVIQMEDDKVLKVPLQQVEL